MPRLNTNIAKICNDEAQKIRDNIAIFELLVACSFVALVIMILF